MNIQSKSTTEAYRKGWDQTFGEHINVCEHGDHSASDGHRFCSLTCERCEHESQSEDGCDGICCAYLCGL